MVREIRIVENILKANDEWALANRRLLAEHGVCCLNLIGSPGAGKTSLLEATFTAWTDPGQLAAVEGDVATALDAERIQQAGGEVVLINTQGACHVAANLINRGLQELDLSRYRLVFVENVGNLVCPSGFDIGERTKVAICSVPEGADKPEKYPRLFQEAGLVVLNKTDLIPHTNFSLERFHESVAKVRPDIQVLTVSATTGQGIDSWLQWLSGQLDSTDQ